VHATPQGEEADHPLQGTKLKIAEAALETLKAKGFNGASAREIAAQGAFNQALIFYHFGSVEKLLLAALELVSRRRMRAYRGPFEEAASLPALAALGRRIYEEDRANGYVIVLGELVTAGASRPQLGAGVAACLEPWLEMVERKVKGLIAGSPLEAIVPPRDAAFAIIALYLGIDMLSHLEGNDARAQSVFDRGTHLATLMAALLPSQQRGRDG
jgi:AcrR family transcriptional regulator